MLTLWKSLIIPIFDYFSQLYHPTKVGYIQKLEIIQRSFIRKITGMHKFTYWEQLKLLKVSSLERRRERYCIIYIWKILEGVDYQSTRLYILKINLSGFFFLTFSSQDMIFFVSPPVKYCLT